jgi:hypothetical protein
MLTAFGLKDFTPLFNWNTKQIFVYVLAQYPPISLPRQRTDDDGQSHPFLSEVVIWDAIISAPESEYSWTTLKDYYFPAKSKSKSKSKSKRKSTSKSSSTAKSIHKPGHEKPTADGVEDMRESSTVLSLKNQKAKYQITDISGKVAERNNVTLTVGWNVQPWVGALWWSPGSGAVIPKTAGQVGRSQTFDFPALKSTGGTGKVSKT